MTRPLSIKTPIGLTLFLKAGVCFSADAHQWVDEKGVTHYGEKPPANPYTTVVTLRGGRIFELDRVKKF